MANRWIFVSFIAPLRKKVGEKDFLKKIFAPFLFPDPSPDMLEVLRSKPGVYSLVHHRPFGDGSFSREGGRRFDGVCACGAFGFGCMPPSAVGEAAGMLRQGGVFVNVVSMGNMEKKLSFSYLGN